MGVMCSYNAINGVPSCANDWLLNDTLRTAWGFEGVLLLLHPVSLNLVFLVLLLRPLLCWSFPVLALMAGYVTSDSGAVEDILINHHYVSNQSLAVADALRAGCDVISGSWKGVSSLRHFLPFFSVPLISHFFIFQ
jgi:beta-D-xylosidase 4